MPLPKLILIIICVFILIAAGYIAWNESFYFDKVPLLIPVDYSNKIPIRNDFRGEGDFAARRNGNRRHQGIDLLAPIGTPVRAAKGGIARPGENKSGMGKFVKIIHRNGLTTIYGHLSKICIKSVQRVRQGDIIGEVGNTGNARYNGIEPHLHFELRQDETPIDPKRYLTK